MLCVQTGALIGDPKRFKFEGERHYLKTAAGMRYLFDDYPEACDNSLWIAERAGSRDRVQEAPAPELPDPRKASSTTPNTLKHITWEGATMRWGRSCLPPWWSGSATSSRSSPTWASPRTS
ncbi:MAG: hypothetical protein R2705_03965 [Ilumatobacteraceae bacterium]